MDIELFEYEAPIENIKYNRIWLLSDLHFGVRANSMEWLQNQPILKSNNFNRKD